MNNNLKILEMQLIPLNTARENGNQEIRNITQMVRVCLIQFMDKTPIITLKHLVLATITLW